MSLQNRIKDILYNKASLMGYGGYLKGTKRADYVTAQELIAQQYPGASKYERNKLVNRYVRQNVLGQTLRPYYPRIGEHYQLDTDRRDALVNAATAYRMIYTALSFRDPGASTNSKRNMARQLNMRMKKEGIKLNDILRDLGTSAEDIQQYYKLKPKQKKEFIKNLNLMLS